MDKKLETELYLTIGRLTFQEQSLKEEKKALQRQVRFLASRVQALAHPTAGAPSTSPCYGGWSVDDDT